MDDPQKIFRLRLKTQKNLVLNEDPSSQTDFSLKFRDLESGSYSRES